LTGWQIMARTHDTAAMRHMHGSTRLMEYLGPSAFMDPFALELVHGSRGMIVSLIRDAVENKLIKNRLQKQ
jgi:hypothetical protein